VDSVQHLTLSRPLNTPEINVLALEIARSLIAGCRGAIANALIAAEDASPANFELAAKLRAQLGVLRAQRTAILNGDLDVAGEVVRIYGRQDNRPG